MPFLIRAACLTDYVEVAHSVGLEPDRLIDAVGLPQASLGNPDLKISLSAFTRLLEVSAKAAKVDNFGLRLAERRLLSNLGPVGLLAREQRTVHEAMEALARYIGLHSDGIRLDVEEQDEFVFISPVVLIRRTVPMRQATELSVGCAFRLLRTFLGAAWKPQFTCFSHGPPSNHDVHLRIFGRRVEYGHEFNGIVCKADDLAQPLHAADPVFARYIRKYLDLIAVRTNTTASDKVRECVWMLLPEGSCSIEQIAQHMGVDRRSVQRRLDREGATFSSIVEAVRMEMVGRYLDDPNRPLYVIARLLGFSSLSAFSRWFRDRYGCSPSNWRAEPLERSDPYFSSGVKSSLGATPGGAQTIGLKAKPA
jgi:AraC-like DNA-binding protein